MFTAIIYLVKLYFSKDHLKQTLKNLRSAPEVVVVSLVMVVVWYFWAWPYFVWKPEDCELISMISSTIMVFSSFLPIITVHKVGIQRDNMVTAIFLWKKSKKEGKDGEKYFDDLLASYVPHIEFGLHFFLVITSCAAVISSMLPPYKQFLTGAFSVFVIAFFHYYCLIAAVKLDNPDLKEMGVPKELIKRMMDLNIKVNGYTLEELNDEQK